MLHEKNAARQATSMRSSFLRLVCIVAIVGSSAIECCGGEKVSSLDVRLEPERGSYFSGERIVLKLHITNKGTDVVDVSPPMFREWLANAAVRVEIGGKPIGIRPGFYVARELVRTTLSLGGGESYVEVLPLSTYYDIGKHNEPTECRVNLEWTSATPQSRVADCTFKIIPCGDSQEITRVNSEAPLHRWSPTDVEPSGANTFCHTIMGIPYGPPEKRRWLLAYSDNNPLTGGWIRLADQPEREELENIRLFILKMPARNSAYATDAHFRMVKRDVVSIEPQTARKTNIGSQVESCTVPITSCIAIVCLWKDKQGEHLYARGKYLSLPELAKFRPDRLSAVQLCGLRPFTFDDLIGPHVVGDEYPVTSLIRAIEPRPLAENVPGAEALIKRMSAFYAGMKSLSAQVALDIRIEAKEGKEGVELKHAYSLVIQRPSLVALRPTAKAEGTVLLVSDGKQFWAGIDGEGSNNKGEAPADAAELFTAENLNPFVPVAVLPVVSKDPAKHLANGLKSGELVGEEDVGGTKCQHLKLVYEKHAVDLWIESGEKPLIRKLAADVSQVMAAQEPDVKKATVTCVYSKCVPDAKLAEGAFALPAKKKAAE